MGEDSETAVMRAKIVSLVARILELPDDAIKGSTPLADCFGSDPDSIRSFVVKLERKLNLPIGETNVGKCLTVDDLAAYCAAQRAPTAGRTYVAVCKMPDGSVCERYYNAKRHHQVEQLALDDGVDVVLSVERVDEDGAGTAMSKVWNMFVLPLVLAGIVGVGGFAYFWWKRGCPSLW